MWFKTLTVYQLTTQSELDAEGIEKCLTANSFFPCPSHQLNSSGWIPPLGRKTQALVHAVNGCYLICLQQEEKVIPAAVLREMAQEKVLEIEEREQRRMRKKEIAQIRDEILQELTPRALTKKRQVYGYIDTRLGLLMLNAAGKAATDFLDRLHKACPEFRCRTLKPGKAPSGLMSAWLDAGWPDGLMPADEIEMRDAEGVVKCKGQDLQGQEIRTHLEAGKEVVRIALQWSGRLQFILGDDLSLRRLRFLDVILEQIDSAASETDETLFDAQFALMALELREFVPKLIDIFSCEKQPGPDNGVGV